MTSPIMRRFFEIHLGFAYEFDTYYFLSKCRAALRSADRRSCRTKISARIPLPHKLRT